MSAIQENVTFPFNPVANVCNAARDTMATLIDGSARELKPKRCRQHNSDAEKFENQLDYRLENKLLALPKYMRHNFVWS